MTAPDVNADVRARLLPCPFCGGSPEVQATDDSERYYFVACNRCGNGTDTAHGPRGAAEQDLLPRWNRRAAHADLSGEVRELVEAARYAMNNIHMVDGTAMDAVVGPTFTVYGMFLNKLHAALAKFTHQEKP